MCNCGCDAGDIDEAKSLRKKAVVAVMFAACLTGVPGVFATAGQSHHALLLSVIALQMVLVTRAIFLVRQRKRLLAGS